MTGTSAPSSGVASSGVKASSIMRGSEYIDMPLGQFLLEVKTDLGEHIYQKAMAKCAELQVLGVIAGVLDGPTEEYRKAIAETAGSYLSNLLARSERTAWWENTSPLDAAATALGYWHKGLAEIAGATGYDDTAKQWHSTGDAFLNTDPEKFLFNASSDFITSIGEDCIKRWDVFWQDFREKVCLSLTENFRLTVHFLPLSWL